MTCPRCHSDLLRSDIGNTDAVCPECGTQLVRNISGVMKTSAVMIAARGESGFYRSVQDVPEPLRTQLIETTTSPNSGIIVIADKAGKEQLTQVMARREQARAESRETQPSTEPAAAQANDLSPVTRLPWLAWAAFIVVLAVSAVLFALFRGDWAGLPLHW
jgi:hypothetical protein